MRSGPDHDPDRMHLFVVLTDPLCNFDDGIRKVLLVSLSSIHDDLYHDSACILEPGEHPFVKRDSYVVYQKARIDEVSRKVYD